MVTKELCDELLADIEKGAKEASIKRQELDRLKKHILVESLIEEESFYDEQKESTIQETFEYLDDNNDEIEYYANIFKSIKDDFSFEDVLELLPSNSHYNYDDIINRLKAECYKEMIEIEDIIVNDPDVTKEECIEFKELINKENLKIKYLNQASLDVVDDDELHHKNKIVLVPTENNEPNVLKELQNIPSEYYEAFGELIESIVDGTFKKVKQLTGNDYVSGLSEVKGHQVRVVFQRIDKNTYALITAFIKKVNNGKYYRNTLIQKCKHYKNVKDTLKEKINNPEFMELNDFYVEELFNLIKLKTTEENKKKVIKHD